MLKAVVTTYTLNEDELDVLRMSLHRAWGSLRALTERTLSGDVRSGSRSYDELHDLMFIIEACTSMLRDRRLEGEKVDVLLETMEARWNALRKVDEQFRKDTFPFSRLLNCLVRPDKHLPGACAAELDDPARNPFLEDEA